MQNIRSLLTLLIDSFNSAYYDNNLAEERITHRHRAKEFDEVYKFEHRLLAMCMIHLLAQSCVSFYNLV